MKPAHLLCVYIGFVGGSLQVLAFPNRWEGLGVVILVTIVLLIAFMVRARGAKKPVKPVQSLRRRNVKRSSVKDKRR
jgi:uncharacterized membrane protein (UPF0136 family)